MVKVQGTTEYCVSNPNRCMYIITLTPKAQGTLMKRYGKNQGMGCLL